jgi:hypothetical protein
MREKGALHIAAAGPLKANTPPPPAYVFSILVFNYFLRNKINFFNLTLRNL